MIDSKALTKAYLAMSEALKSEREEILSLNKSEFLNRLTKQKKVKTKKGTCIFANKEYKPYFTKIEQSVFVYMFDNDIFSKEIHLKRRNKKTYKIDKVGEIYTFFINDRYTKNKALLYFVVESEVENDL